MTASEIEYFNYSARKYIYEICDEVEKFLARKYNVCSHYICGTLCVKYDGFKKYIEYIAKLILESDSRTNCNPLFSVFRMTHKKFYNIKYDTRKPVELFSIYIGRRSYICEDPYQLINPYQKKMNHLYICQYYKILNVNIPHIICIYILSYLGHTNYNKMNIKQTKSKWLIYEKNIHEQLKNQHLIYNV